ncbi:predicted protein [Scheffersomyces stipitis CBS 6054]|uniref:t-SNARE coiled-coil homology domain-containing protein n=1 Tax=Scheffersomyces stipitis (strain ATCC 58785 / CBS 6054 / NBRC 10063 / NRRL Y-11545) TaxID=322104 RepID=A3LQU7_PICST|nr:predicted protein [Scheffersomyces stipitis CBS 6054]ABN65271.2 predicted protein [Scheffersomyces stipitis CBS 6054]
MAPSISEVRASQSKINVYLDELNSNLEERDRLVEVLRLTPSANDNYELISLLQKLVKYFKYLQQDLISLIKVGENVEQYINQFREAVAKYEDVHEKLAGDSSISVSEYHFTPAEFPQRKTPISSVRFQEDILDKDADDHFRNENFKPYSDEESSNNTDSESFDAQTNQHLFAQHQQTILEQDQSLDVLHQSIIRQHTMGQSINSELDDHLILLNDLENGVDDANYRLNTAANRLHEFRKRVRENGSLVTIIVLTVILIMLLVVLN